MPRLLALAVGAALDRLPALDRFVGARADARRLQAALERIRRRGLELEVVYDIGAHRGQWTEAVRASLPGARFFLFEANAAHAETLQATGERYFTALLSSEEKLVDFYGTGGTGDSYFREATSNYAGVAPTVLAATTLDRLIETHGLPYPDLIKADVQGAELDVLRGGQTALGQAKLVLLECPIVRYNEGAPSIDAYFRFMHERGFTPLEFVQPIWRKGQMIQVDVLFARRADAARLAP